MMKSKGQRRESCMEDTAGAGIHTRKTGYIGADFRFEVPGQSSVGQS